MLAIALANAAIVWGASTPYGGSPIDLPGTIQAENFDEGGAEIAYHDTSAGNSGGGYRNTGVDLQATLDSGLGYNVGWASAGEWLHYTVDVATTGIYTIDVRVASTGTGGRFHVEANGADVTGSMTVPNTGGWQTWTTVTRANVALQAGTQILRLVMEAAGSTGAVGNFNWMRATLTAAGGSTPYGGTPIDLPGTIQAENFDEGGAEIAYHDTSAGNSGGGYRNTGVDLQATLDSGLGYNVGWASAGEWLHYTVDVATAGIYTIDVRVASTGTGGRFHVEANGADVTGSMTVPNTGGWQTWTTVTRANVALQAGTQILRLVMEAAGSTGAVGNFNWMRATLTAAGGSTPYGGTPIDLPGTIQAENFDEGGAEIAYHDTSAGNSGGGYRNTGVDLQATRDSGLGYNVGWTTAGEWLHYTVDVATAGIYTIDVRVASTGTGGRFHVEANGADVTGSMTVPNTGGWQTWTTVTRANVALQAGTQILRLVMEAAGSTGAVGNFNWMRVSAGPVDPLTMTLPMPGGTLRTIRVTFEWTGTGDEFWLNIGSTPGGNDVYSSASLGRTLTHTVDDLPLNGQVLHVQVRRRVGSTFDSASAQYTAAVRKGLAIITDFADRTFEQWTGAGMRSVTDLEAQLRNMEDHWEWLSRGRETMRWDVTRIRLPQNAVPDAFPSWWDFRIAVGTLVKEHIDLGDYDVNSDGVLDISWAITSIGDMYLGWAIGGSSRNADVNIFVDSQASASVKGGHTGNFNHETAHLVGIVDMYGTYGTLGSLTIMSYPWPRPAGDFAAYERLTLGWLDPRVITQSTQRVWLPPPEDQIAAVKIPTSRPAEYFLIDYRRRPATGFGSDIEDHDGLAVYHVLEGSWMGQDPPLVKVEPADGSITPSRPLDPYDLLYPGNPVWTPPMVLRSYYDDGQEVFRIDNVAWVNGGMMFDITMAPPLTPSNLLTNPSFENGSLEPDGWLWGAYGASAEGFVWPSPVAHSGTKSALIESPLAGDRWWNQSASMIRGERYILCGWLKGDGISGSIGANVSLTHRQVRSWGVTGTFDWLHRCVAFTAAASREDVACRLGFYLENFTGAGKLWCEDMSLEHLRSAFDQPD